MEEDYEANAVHRWRRTAENAMGCHMGLAKGERDCHKCEGLQHCLNYHEETLAGICNFIADLVEESGGLVTKGLSEQIKKASEKVFKEAEEAEKPEYKDNYYL